MFLSKESNMCARENTYVSLRLLFCILLCA